MPRIQFSDVTPPEKRSIRNIPIPSGGKRKIPILKKPQPEEPVFEESGGINEPPTGRDPEKRKRHWFFGAIIVILIAIFILVMMTVFASATVKITPKTQQVDVEMNITATIEKEASSVRYEVIKISKSGTASIAATGEEAVELKSSGKIVIYNNFSPDPQRLIVRTRFETPEGLIYRIPESVVIPGRTTKNGVDTPGSIEVEVFADEAGEKFNIKKTDFTVPGFKNDQARYKGIYARSSTEMTGGFIGKKKKVAEADKKEALDNIDTEIRTALQKELSSKVPAGLALLSNSIIYESRDLPQKDDGNSAVIGKELTAYAIMLNIQDLAEKIADKYTTESADWNKIKATVKDFSLLEIIDKPTDTEIGGKLELQIKGKAKILADINTSDISLRLVGSPRQDTKELLTEFAGISGITATIRPMWKQSFPSDPQKLRVQTVSE
jgi:hypothetical protein